MKKIKISKNEYELYEDHAIMIVNNNTTGIHKAKIDLEDVEKCMPISWNYNNKSGYIQTPLDSNNKRNSLARFIMNDPKDMIIDHINGDKKDNRKNNLRVVTSQQNMWNTKAIGVSIDKRCKNKVKYRAYIQVNKKLINLGTHDNYEEAVKARKEAEKQYFGEFRRTNKFERIK